jgi:hypothetical protein
MEVAMANGGPKRPYFLVYIVESPSPVDLYHKRYEGEALGRALELAGIRSEHKLVVNTEALQAALQVGLKELLDEHRDYLPIVHLSAHGGEDGVQLTDGTIITWTGLRELVAPVNVLAAVRKRGILTGLSTWAG